MMKPLLPAVMVDVMWGFLPLGPAGAVLAAAVEVGGNPVFLNDQNGDEEPQSCFRGE
jgi:hypothetical protein